jgi:hypothetical protein
MDEVIIGRPLLETLGLNAEEHLSSVRDEYKKFDCSQIPSVTSGGKLTRLLLRELVDLSDTPVRTKAGPKRTGTVSQNLSVITDVVVDAIGGDRTSCARSGGHSYFGLRRSRPASCARWLFRSASTH